MTEAAIPLTLAEACALLNMRPADVAELLGGPDDPEAVHGMTLRHALAVKVTDALLPLVDHDIAIRCGVSAGREARIGGHRLLVVARARDGRPAACWREADSDWNILNPCICIPGDRWLTALRTSLDTHRAAIARAN